MTQASTEFLDFQAALAGEYPLQRELGRGLSHPNIVPIFRVGEAGGFVYFEGIRLDLLRLHAGAGDLASLTTLLDAAWLSGEDVSRLADARRAVDGVAPPRLAGARRAATPV